LRTKFRGARIGEHPQICAGSRRGLPGAGQAEQLASGIDDQKK